ncbi:restriction endonuclease subunit S [Candidatus Pacearchaeota archaeon]|nr:restriction endonuclease subunit S [Candidatus Pacearchaeota archaeon]
MKNQINQLVIEWKDVELRNLGELIMGQSPKGNSYNNEKKGIPLLNGAADFKYNQIMPKQFTTQPTKISRKGDLLFCIRATIGKTIISDGVYCLGRGVAGFRVNEDLLKKEFLLKILDNKLKNLVLQGSTIMGVKGKDIESIKIPLPFLNGQPDLETQKAIVSILEKAEQLKEKRKQAIKLLDEYVKSTFNEMFMGKGFEIKGFFDVVNTTTGKLDSNAMEKDGKYPFFTCSQETFKINNYAFDCEALLLSGNNAAGRYSVKYYKGKFNAYQRTYILTLKEKGDFRYIHFVLTNKLEELQRKSIGTNTKYLTLGILKSLKIPHPPLPLQQTFASMVEHVEKLKEKQNQSLKEIEQLFNALMQKAFNGELVR